jgi:ribosomal protein L37E
MKFIEYPSTYLCEYCGHSSQSRERCTQCGHPLENPAEIDPPRWGRMKVRLHAPTDIGQLWKKLARYWSEWEAKPELALIPSQLERFDTSADTLELYGSDFEVRALRQLLRGKGSVEFEELPGERIPRRSHSSTPQDPSRNGA